VLKACDEIGELLDLKFSTVIMGGIEPLPRHDLGGCPGRQDWPQLSKARSSQVEGGGCSCKRCARREASVNLSRRGRFCARLVNFSGGYLSQLCQNCITSAAFSQSQYLRFL
jgi:hypothetical protein